MNASQLTHLAAVATVFTAVAAAAPAALAQSDSSPPSRAEVDQQTRAAMATGHMLPAGELIPVDMPKVSTVNREQLKAETVAVNRTGALGDYGWNSYGYGHNVALWLPLRTSTKTRADGKAQTMQAIKQHQMVPAGEFI